MSNASSDSPQPTEQAAVPTRFWPLPWRTGPAAIGIVVWLLVAQAVGGVLFKLVQAVVAQFGVYFAPLQSSVWQQFLLIMLIEACSVAGVLWFVRRYRNRDGGGWSVLGLTRPGWRDLKLMAAGFGVYFLSLTIIERIVPLLLPVNVNQKQDIGFTGASGFGSLTLVFLSLVVLPPIAEEIMMRGFLYGSLRHRLRPVVAALITSAVFAALHLPGGQINSGPLWIAAIDTFTLSLVLCFLRERTGRLWACIGLHALKNSLAFLALFVFHVA